MKQETQDALKAALAGLEEEMRCDNGALPNVVAARHFLEFRAHLAHREQFAALWFHGALMVSFEPLAFDGYPVSVRDGAMAAVAAQATSVAFMELRSPQSAAMDIKSLTETLEFLGITVITTVTVGTFLSAAAPVVEANFSG